MEEGKTFSWQFAKLDKRIKDRYCPFYYLEAGIEGGKFVTKQKFTQIWQQKMMEQEVLTQSKFSEAEKNEALKFDLLAFHTLLYRVYKVLDIDEAVTLSVEPYLAHFGPYFTQSFLD